MAAGTRDDVFPVRRNVDCLGLSCLSFNAGKIGIYWHGGNLMRTFASFMLSPQAHPCVVKAWMYPKIVHLQLPAIVHLLSRDFGGGQGFLQVKVHDEHIVWFSTTLFLVSTGCCISSLCCSLVSRPFSCIEARASGSCSLATSTRKRSHWLHVSRRGCMKESLKFSQKSVSSNFASPVASPCPHSANSRVNKAC